LKKTTFKDKKVQQVLAQNFVSISIDTDKNRDLATQWRVTGLPTLWFLKPDGSKIERIPGYVDPGQMVKILNFVDSKQYEQVSFHDFIKRL
jgi:thioredoxin-related protein